MEAAVQSARFCTQELKQFPGGICSGPSSTIVEHKCGVERFLGCSIDLSLLFIYLFI